MGLLSSQGKWGLGHTKARYPSHELYLGSFSCSGLLQNHRFSYNEPMSVESTTQALCDLALRFGEGDEESMVWALPLLCLPVLLPCGWRD
jgi:hypothetical protein